jgi:hypothetical protein
MNTVTLQQAGYPLAANDLTREEWFDLARVKALLEPRVMCPLMAGKK